MSIIKKVFRKRYCKSCYRVEYYREKCLEGVKELSGVKSKYDKNDKLMQKLNSVINNNEHLLYMSDSGFITVRQRFDDYGILRYLDFNGYFINEIYERSIPQRLYVSVEKDIKERYVKSFYIIDFLCSPLY